MATATSTEQPSSLPVQTKTLSPANTKVQAQAQAQQIQVQKRPLPAMAMSTPTQAQTPVNRAVKRDSGHSHNSINSMQTHAHQHQKHGSTDSSGSSSNSTTADSTGRLSFSQRAAQLARAPTPLLVKGDRHLLRDIDRPPPGDPSTKRRSMGPDLAVESMAAGPTAVGADTSHLSRKRSQYFEDAFATRRGGDADTSPAKERVRSEALVLAEVRTNVIVGDEFTVVTELSAHLALRYRRPLSSVVVNLQHGACMCFGGSFAPAYVMAVYGLPSQLQPATNKRNAALIQRHMEETLAVPPARGHLRFVAVSEANLAYSGTTALGHADDLARVAAETSLPAPGTAGLRSPTGSVKSPAAGGTMVDASLTSGLGSRKYQTARKLSVKSLSNFRSPSPSLSLSPPELTPPPSAVEEHPPAQQLPAIPEKEGVGEKKSKPKAKTAAVPASATEGRTKSSGIQAMTERTPLDSPAAVSIVGRQPSRRARRTKSFVATLFGRSTPKPEGGSP